MLNLLIDDCQLVIISYLSFKDQQMLCAAAIDYSSSLQNNVMYAWGRKSSYILEKDDFKEFEQNPELLDAFLCAISPKLQKLELKNVTLEHLKHWKKHTFPKMTSLNYTLDAGIKLNADDALKLIVEMFPNLNIVQPYGTVDYKLFTELKELRQLDLKKCFSTGDSDKFLCECTMLRELMLYRRLDKDVYENLLRMPKLRTFCLEGLHGLLIFMNLDDN